MGIGQEFHSGTAAATDELSAETGALRHRPLIKFPLKLLGSEVGSKLHRSLCKSFSFR